MSDFSPKFPAALYASRFSNPNASTSASPHNRAVQPSCLDSHDSRRRAQASGSGPPSQMWCIMRGISHESSALCDGAGEGGGVGAEGIKTVPGIVFGRFGECDSSSQSPAGSGGCTRPELWYHTYSMSELFLGGSLFYFALCQYLFFFSKRRALWSKNFLISNAWYIPGTLLSSSNTRANGALKDH